MKSKTLKTSSAKQNPLTKRKRGKSPSPLKPRVSVIMGSDSDYPVMQEALKALSDFGISHEVQVVSAHRTPERMQTYAKTCLKRGVQVIIAGAGGAAHLPGMVAGLTTLPVIGVPVMTQALKGLDSLVSVAQMPKGVPVATVAINGAYNAGVLAARVLASAASDSALTKKLRVYAKNQKNKTLRASQKIQSPKSPS